MRCRCGLPADTTRCAARLEDGGARRRRVHRAAQRGRRAVTRLMMETPAFALFPPTPVCPSCVCVCGPPTTPASLVGAWGWLVATPTPTFPHGIPYIPHTYKRQRQRHERHSTGILILKKINSINRPMTPTYTVSSKCGTNQPGPHTLHTLYPSISELPPVHQRSHQVRYQ